MAKPREVVLMSEKGAQRRNRLKKLLLDRKKKMWVELRDEFFRKLGREYNAQFDNPHDIEELALIDIIEDTGIAVADIKRQEIADIDESLRRLDAGTYGACSVCGADIGEDRLKAMPFVDTCVQCKARTEGPKKHSL